ncbi:MAG TPA: methyltransferase, partial [Clostridia bacterium]|nr:methyltransferase [Clostridia bacterium]
MSELLLDGEYLEDLQRNGLRIIQSRDGYRFTADSVILAHFAADSPLTGTVVDLGTGSGVVLLLLSALCPQAKLVGVEIQEKAADMARRSVLINGLQSSIEIIQGDLRDISTFIRR